MLSCNELSLNYAIVLYDKAHSKIEIVQDIIQELPSPPHTAYFLCDSWYTSNKLMDAFAQKGFQTIGAMRTIVSFIPIRSNNRLSSLLRASVRMIRMSAS